MQQYQRPVLKQEQRLKLTPQLYQAIQIMALPIQDLRLKIEEELEQNPALEVIEDPSEVSYDEVAEPDPEYSVFEETSDPGFTRRNGEEASDMKRQFIEGALTRPESLRDHLIWQLRLHPIKPEWFELGQLLIRNLDENGFHIEAPETLVRDDSQRPVLRAVMEIIQRLDPPGCCTADYLESLLVQARNSPNPHPLAETLIANHMALLEKGKTAEIARKIKTDKEDVEAALSFIRTLDPLPGRNYASDVQYVVPDISVQLRDGEFVIILNDEEVPVLGINAFFTEINKDKSRARGRELSRFVSTRVNDARWFIRSIRQRNETLLKTVKAIVEFQREFFRKGPKFLIPLTLKDIAGEIGVHEATVSRITTSKYIQTEWGIFELKYFFTNSISGSGSSGSRFSKEGVKEMIREIIEEEGHDQLSDRKIADILEGKGVKIARRTVSKYRKELDISSSFYR